MSLLLLVPASPPLISLLALPIQALVNGNDTQLMEVLIGIVLLLVTKWRLQFRSSSRGHRNVENVDGLSLAHQMTAQGMQVGQSV